MGWQVTMQWVRLGWFCTPEPNPFIKWIRFGQKLRPLSLLLWGPQLAQCTFTVDDQDSYQMIRTLQSVIVYDIKQMLVCVERVQRPDKSIKKLVVDYWQEQYKYFKIRRPWKASSSLVPMTQCPGVSLVDTFRSFKTYSNGKDLFCHSNKSSVLCWTS